MSNHTNILCSWSGGKDSCYALMQAIEMGHSPKVLLNVLNEAGQISRSHGIPAEILQAQASAAGLPMHMVSSSWQDYTAYFTAALAELSQRYALTHAVFGDIDLQAHRDWEEQVCNTAGLVALLPLWQQDRKELVVQMLHAGIETMIVSCNTTMGHSYLGKRMTLELVSELEALGIDPCGENGEFHTLVTYCPLFRERVQVEVTNKMVHDRYWFSELKLMPI